MTEDRSGTFHLCGTLSNGNPSVVGKFGPPEMFPVTGVWIGR